MGWWVRCRWLETISMNTKIMTMMMAFGLVTFGLSFAPGAAAESTTTCQVDQFVCKCDSEPPTYKTCSSTGPLTGSNCSSAVGVSRGTMIGLGCDSLITTT